jgi:hypothetical protein
MTRFLLIVLLLVILRLAFKNFTAQLRSAVLGDPPRQVPPPRAPRAAVTETLVPCAACGTFVPANRSLEAPGGGGEAFCSEECRTRGAAG